MSQLSESPKLGHITTFGGHPVIAAAALATLTEVIESNLMQEALEKEKLIREHLKHPLIQNIRGRGLMLAAITPSSEITNQVILKCQGEGLILFWLLFEPRAIRITPPLTISNEELIKGCKTIVKILNSVAI
jgi:4-aminobutyrate aminotransferase and related aminotransferases